MPGSSLANLTFANDIPAEERRHCRTDRLGHDTGKIQHRHRCAAGPHCYQDVLRRRRPMNEHMARLCHQRWPKVAMECKNECVNSDGCSYVVGNERTRTTDGITNTYHHTHTHTPGWRRTSIPPEETPRRNKHAGESQQQLLNGTNVMNSVATMYTHTLGKQRPKTCNRHALRNNNRSWWARLVCDTNAFLHECPPNNTRQKKPCNPCC
jgi:hypothetical protein